MEDELKYLLEKGVRGAFTPRFGDGRRCAEYSNVGWMWREVYAAARLTLPRACLTCRARAVESHVKAMLADI